MLNYNTMLRLLTLLGFLVQASTAGRAEGSCACVHEPGGTTYRVEGGCDRGVKWMDGKNNVLVDEGGNHGEPVVRWDSRHLTTTKCHKQIKHEGDCETKEGFHSSTVTCNCSCHGGGFTQEAAKEVGTAASVHTNTTTPTEGNSGAWIHVIVVIAVLLLGVLLLVLLGRRYKATESDEWCPADPVGARL